MEFLDKKKQRLRTIQLYIGYGLAGLAIIAVTIILLYQAYGFGLDKNGQVIQNGLLFLSSQPANADIYVNGTRKGTTNTRLFIPAGQYQVAIKKTDYRDWNRQITVEGGKPLHFDYPFLFPTTLTTNTKQPFDTSLAFVTQSPDRRWLLAAQYVEANQLKITQIDLKDPKSAATTYVLPANIAAQVEAGDTWEAQEWSNDNRHLLVKHHFSNSTEYLLLDRQTIGSSQNISKLLNTSAEVNLFNKRSDQFLLYDATAKTVSTANAKSPSPVVFASNVLSYETYNDDTILYASDHNAPEGKVNIMLKQGSSEITLRSVAANSTYLLNLTKYDGDLYVAAGAANEDKVYIYKDPVETLNAVPKQVLVPVSVLKVTNPNYLSFSSNTRFIMAENGAQFSVYDAENDRTYAYTAAKGLDAPQTSARWMDGNRITYVSGGKLEVIDYDNNNPQTLMTADPNYLPFFDSSYRYVYAVVMKDSKPVIENTSLLTPADQ